MKTIDGGVTAPKGFKATGVAAGIRKKDRRDCALIVSDVEATVAGTFTKNLLKAPPVEWDEQVCRGGKARAVFINSGNANACTGEGGRQDVRQTAEWVAQAVGCPVEQAAICSTGVIGVRLPMPAVALGVTEAAACLSVNGSSGAAAAIMTTDLVAKETALEIQLSGGTVRLGAIAKGSGMIAPNMATMICIITTDAAIAPDLLQHCLNSAVEVSFNRICVDNDMSTSDTVLCLANGQSGAAVEADTNDFRTFADAVTVICRDMAKRIVKDGEGATKFVEILVTGAPDNAAAVTVARAIAQSQLCKTAFFGQDPNWGRIVCAAGYSGVSFDPDKMALWLNDVQLVKQGMPADYQEKDAAAVMQQPEFQIRIDLGAGAGDAFYWTSDLSHDYVSINADYRT
jgi:glutamate N-acetyltransferase/amino-acid N-acetyltransferase